MSARGSKRCSRIRKLQCALGLLPHNHIHLRVVKARLCHRDFIKLFSGHLVCHFELWNMLSCREGIRERVKILEAVLMSLVHRKGRPLCLKVEVDESGRPRLYHRLVKSIHGAELKRVKIMRVQRFLHLLFLGDVQRSKSFTNAGSSFFLVFLGEVFFVLPDFV